MIKAHQPQGSLNNHITVVFDGYSAAIEQMTFPGINVVFSRDISADDRIIQIVSSARIPKGCIIVTDDRAIVHAVRQLGAGVLSVKDFLQKFRTAERPGTVRAGIKDVVKLLGKNLEDKITKEFENIWLRSKEKE